MTRFVFITCFLLCGVTWSIAQTTDDFAKNEFFAGYSYNSADINTLTVDPKRTGKNGVNLAYTRYLNKNVGITGDISAHFSRRSQTRNGGPFESERDQYFALAGVKFAASSDSRVTPFAHALVGASLFRGFTSNITPGGNVFTTDDATSLAMAFGGGLDVRVNKRVSVRLVQADYIPTFFGTGRQDNIRLSFGIVFK